ncbi:uncharacterized protein K489DRAFT_378829 [Dissoconium aciculare CBS 342.82]|uniref:Uncharacterized protein n=1 Tax=Dissoconium aciculare CBS 342.82 TaxID=1314786 RepID=A0A6J3M8T4_9PEZI|nr:uncharacterized protein K489DRAFT_378829 [Dissoconium aciculare CBS 342.82]KAF1824410.1 hypothetical protein K489DRAFT_378829 [Dissoconium aciculare CBS 342.82]
MFVYDLDVDGSVEDSRKDVKPMAKEKKKRKKKEQERYEGTLKDLAHEESKKGPVRSMEERKKERASGSKADCHLSVPTAQVC